MVVSQQTTDVLLSAAADDEQYTVSKEQIFVGWPSKVDVLPTELRPYASLADDLIVSGGCSTKAIGSRIPAECETKFYSAYMPATSELKAVFDALVRSYSSLASLQRSRRWFADARSAFDIRQSSKGNH